MLKHSDGIAGHLQRIFIYGDEMKESGRVNEFLEYVNTRINPFTKKAYDLGARSLYRYISGEQHFPVDLLPPLVDWSLDEKLMEAYNIYPSPTETERLRQKIEEEEKQAKRHLDRAKMMKSRLKK